MAKKLMAVLSAAAIMVTGVSAQDAKKEDKNDDGPKVGVEFVQRMDAEYVDDYATASGTYGTDTLYSRTEIKGSAAFALAEGFTLSASAKDRLEVRLNPGNLEGVDAGVEKLGKIRDRNRLYLNLDAAIALDKAFNLGLGAEYRLATDLRTDKEGAVVPENRIAPSLTLSGKIDLFSYSLVNSFAMYLDSDAANLVDDFYSEFEGTYGVGLTLKLDDKASLKLDLGDYLDLVLPTSANATAGALATSLNSLTFKASLVAGDLVPMLGFLLNSSTDSAGVVTNQVVGGTCGLEFKKGNMTFSVGGDLGVNTAAGKNNALESHITAQVKIKG